MSELHNVSFIIKENTAVFSLSAYSQLSSPLSLSPKKKTFSFYKIIIEFKLGEREMKDKSERNWKIIRTIELIESHSLLETWSIGKMTLFLINLRLD